MLGAQEAMSSTELLLHSVAKSSALLGTWDYTLLLEGASAVVLENVDGTHIED